MAGTPFHELEGKIWYDGEMIEWRDANFHVLTHALHYASSVFEGERVYGGKIFELTKHTERLFNSADIMGFEIPWTVAEIDAACYAACEVNGIVDGYVRPIAWRGSEQMGVTAQDTKIHPARTRVRSITVTFSKGPVRVMAALYPSALRQRGVECRRLPAPASASRGRWCRAAPRRGAAVGAMLGMGGSRGPSDDTWGGGW